MKNMFSNHKIYYLGFYDKPEKQVRRDSVLASANKMSYIAKAVHRTGRQVEIVSICGAEQFEHSSYQEIYEGVFLRLFTSFGRGPLVKRVLSRWFLQLKWFLYILFHVGRDDTVLVYHSLGYMKRIYWLKRIKRFRLILEIEEIYSDVIGKVSMRRKELRFFNCADAYLFPTELLNESVNTSGKPAVIIYGTYQVEEKRNDCGFADDPRHELKHFVYAGTFDPRKGGMAAAAAAKFMSGDCHVHILGFGSDSDREKLENVVAEVNRSSGGRVSMDGLLNGDDYIHFLQSCDAGFSTQQTDAAFNNTSFPSKVLSYLANGLRVVSVRIPSLERSTVNSLLYYYDGNSPEAIARAGAGIDWKKPYDSREVIQELDHQFVKGIGKLLDSL